MLADLDNELLGAALDGLGKIELTREPREILAGIDRTRRQPEFTVERGVRRFQFVFRRAGGRDDLFERPRHRIRPARRVNGRRCEPFDRASPEQARVLGRVEQHTRPIADRRRQSERAREPPDLGERVHLIALGLRRYLRSTVLAAHPSELTAFAAFHPRRIADLSGQPPIVTRSGEWGTRPDRIRVVVVERPPLRAVIDRILAEHQSTLLTNALGSIASHSTVTLWTTPDCCGVHHM